MYDVVALGELLIDFTQSGVSPSGMRLFEQNPGGAPANVLCALAGFGKRTALIGKVGADMHGDFLRETLIQKGVDVRGLISDPDVFTTLAFVSLTEGGERSFSFARKPGADTCLEESELDIRLLKECRVFHFGSLSLCGQPARGATLAAAHAAKEAGAILSYDPNYRASLWPDRQTAVARMRSLLGLADIVKISADETALLTGHENPVQAAAALLEAGVGCAVVTLGKDGGYAATRQASVRLGVPEVGVVDTTGAGDAFWGGFLNRLLDKGKTPAALTGDDLTDCLRFAGGAATLCVQKRGGIPAMPTLAEVMDALKGCE